LIPAYLQGQTYVESQEHVTVQQWMEQRGIPQSVTDEVFLAMSKGANMDVRVPLWNTIESRHCSPICLSLL
jgi:hypothetical protein